MKTIRLLIADDHPIFRDGLRTLLSSVDGLDIVGEAATGDEAVEIAATLKPEVVLMDIQMPGINGIEATRRIVQSNPDIKVLMLTMFEDDISILAAMRAGARGYLLKGTRQAEALRAIQAVAHGEMIFGAQLTEKLKHLFNSTPASTSSTILPELTNREFEILGLIAQRMSNLEIARRLTLSPKTVRNHVSSIFHKLHVNDRSEAILAARAAGIGQK